MPDIRFVNLQHDSAAADRDVADLVASRRLVHWADALADYDRTAALVQSLDLVVSVCTAVIHLAGALGARVWVMAPYGPEWRYGFATERMPWYPSACVIRQSGPGDWDSVVEEVCRRLGAWGSAALEDTPANPDAARSAGPDGSPCG
jgi:hypothetical protein